MTFVVFISFFVVVWDWDVILEKVIIPNMEAEHSEKSSTAKWSSESKVNLCSYRRTCLSRTGQFLTFFFFFWEGGHFLQHSCFVSPWLLSILELCLCQDLHLSRPAVNTAREITELSTAITWCLPHLTVFKDIQIYPTTFVVKSTYIKILIFHSLYFGLVIKFQQEKWIK